MDEPNNKIENKTENIKNKSKFTKIILFSVVPIILIIAFLFLFTNDMVDSKYDKVILIGVDGMDQEITNKLLAEGKLPNLQKLSEQGSYTLLETSYPPHSPVAWASIATGKNPAKHNIFDFIRRDKDTYFPILSLSKSKSGTEYESFVKADPFWRLTTNAKIPTTIIRWPISFPPERIEGNLLPGLGIPDIRGLLSGYTFYTSSEIDKPSSKLMQVTVTDSQIKTKLNGPKTRKGGELTDITLDMNIKISEDQAELTISNQSTIVKKGEWSDWVRVKFKVSVFKSVYGIFKVYISNTDPFEMYLTTIQIDPENPMIPITAPADYSSELAKDIGLYYTLGMPEETDGYVDDKLSKEAFLEQVAEIEEERKKMFWKEFDNFDSGVFAFVFDSSDRIKHVFWKEQEVVEEHYIIRDKFIGEVLEKVDDDALVFVFSDHGFTSFDKAISMNTWFVENGFMTLTQEIKEGEDGALFRHVDWSNTKAYAVGFNSIYLNQKGRESQGIVENREEVINEIVKSLEALEDSEGNKVINKVYRREEIYNGPLIGDAPDLIVGFNEGYRMSWETAIGGFTKDVIYNNTKKWNGDHLIDPTFVPGVLFTNLKLNKESYSQRDIAPTVLDAVGIPVPEDMDGESLLKTE